MSYGLQYLFITQTVECVCITLWVRLTNRDLIAVKQEPIFKFVTA